MQVAGWGQMLLLTKRPYVSAYAPRGIPVSGPPSSLLQLPSPSGFKNLRSTSVPIFSPYHSSPLSSENDIEHIVEGLASDAAARPNWVPITSSCGTIAQGGDFDILLKAAVGQIIRHPIRWDNVIQEL